MDQSAQSSSETNIESAAIAAIALDAVISIDTAGIVAAWNPHAETVFGWSREEAIGVPIADLIIPEADRERHWNGLEKYLRTGVGPVLNQRIEVGAVTKSGTPIPIELAITPVKLGEKLFFTAFLRDISTRIKAERELQDLAVQLEARVQERTAELAEKNVALELAQTEAKRGREDLQRFIDSMLTMNGKFGLDGVPIMINKAGMVAGNFDPETLGMKPIWKHPFCEFDPSVSQRLRESVIQAATGAGNIYEDVFLILGTRTPVEINMVPVFDSAGNVEYVLGEARDISARKAVENELLKRTQQLEASNKELEAFCYSVSHDLRAPLRAIDGYAHALKEDYSGALDESAIDYLSRIRGSAQKMAQLIDDLLNLSRLALIKLRYSEVDLSRLASETVEDLRTREPERLAKVSIAANLKIVADSTLMNSLVTNLISNAWKFTSHEESAEIEIGSQTVKGEEVFFVRDNGAGFDMAYVKKLFGVFERLHSPKEFPGSGIGLATAARIVERHGGKIWAVGKEGEGATFYFTLGVHHDFES